MALTVDIRDIKRAQLVGTQPATIKQQNDQAITPRRRSRGGHGLHEPLGLLQVERLRHRAPQRMLQTKSIEHVALSAAAAPGVFKQSSHVTEILRQAAFGRTAPPLGFQPMQIIFQLEVPQLNAGTPSLKPSNRAAQRATHVHNRARRLASNFIQVTEVSLDQRIHRGGIRFIHALTPCCSNQSLMGWRVIAARRCGSAMCTYRTVVPMPQCPRMRGTWAKCTPDSSRSDAQLCRN